MGVKHFLEKAFPGHSIDEKLREDDQIVIFRGRGDGRALLFVTSLAAHPAPQWLARVEREYALRDDLELPWAARPLARLRPEGRVVLLLEDPGGHPLEASAPHRTSVADSLRLGVGVAASLARVHASGLVHRDLKPANILTNPTTGGVALTGFGLATLSTRERHGPDRPEESAGTLAYMAPERTGRMSRPVDARSDLYSLGAVLYESLTGRLPFSAAEPSELLQSHLARQAVPPIEVEPTIPRPVSDLVMKLLEKAPEARYQTAFGLEMDLHKALSALEAHGNIEAFPLGEEDIPNEPRPLDKLHGREAETEALRAAWKRVTSGGASELVLVSGLPGAGKSSLVDALRREVVRGPGLFAAGSFDEQKRNIPYASLAQAFQNLVRQLLVKPEEEIAEWRHQLEAAVSPNGRVLTDMLPELELLLGRQTEVWDLAPLEAKNRLVMTFGRFLDAIATPEHPLALFLDDLQWEDPATLELLVQLFLRPGRRNLLLLGAYRSNAVDATHPSMVAIDSLRAAGLSVHDIGLGPLAPEAFVALVADMLRCPAGSVEPLARLVWEKTGGNPFFALQFVTALHEEQLLSSVPQTRDWRFDLEVIRAKAHTDNVADLLASRFDRLSGACQRTLQVFACLGMRAETRVLLHAAGVTTLMTAPGAPGGRDAEPDALLCEAERTGLVVRRADSHAFVHDRVREAAYASIAPAERAREHVRLGRILLAHRAADEVGDEGFVIVNQFNRGLDLLEDAVERNQVRRLNLRAGRRSKAGAAYEAARVYLTQARALLPTDPWGADYAETFATFLELAEAEYLVGRFEQASSLFSETLDNARDALDQAKVLGLRQRLYDTSGNYRDALETGLHALRLLGSAVPESDEAIREAVEAEQAEVPSLLRGRRIIDLVQAPDVPDPSVRASLDLLVNLLSAAYLVKPELYPWLVSRGLTLSLRHGNTASSCLAYNGYAIVLLAQRDIPSAIAFSDLALALNDRFGDVTRRGALLLGRGAIVSLWIQPLLECKAVLERGAEAAFLTGDYPAVLSNAMMAVLIDVEAAESAEAGRRTSEKSRELAEQVHSDTYVAVLRLCEQHFLRLQGLPAHPRETVQRGARAEEDQESAVEVLLKANFEMGLFSHHFLNLMFAFTFGEFEEALKHADKAWELRGQRPFLFLYDITLVFFHALTLTALSTQVPPERRASFTQRLEELLPELKFWAENRPETFSSRYALITAEKARLDGRELEAMQAYARAISSARESGFVFLESLACEVAGRYYLNSGFEKNGHAHLRDARAGFLCWGAYAKVAQLDRLYPGVEKPASPGPLASVGASLSQFDVARVVKASQAVSGEIETGKLVECLMGLVMDHAGADRGLLLLPAADGFVVEAEAVLDRQELGIQQPRTPLVSGQLADGVFRYVVRTREPVILEDASVDGLFTEDEYVTQRRSKSILGLPLLKQARLLGVLYLENSLAPGVFTPNRVTALEVLGSQAAISLENARLFAQLEQEKSRLQASEERFAKAFKMNPTPMAVIRCKDLMLLDANEQFLDLLGRAEQEVRGRHTSQIGGWLTASLSEAGKRLAAGESFRDQEFSAATKPGDSKTLLASVETMILGAETCYLAAFIDLTERKHVEAQLRQSQKMEAIGSLAGGVAHDFNNILTAINGYSDLAMMGLDVSSEQYEFLSAIRSSGDRAAALTRQLLAFSRKEKVLTQVQSLNAIVKETDGLLRRVIEENVEIRTHLQPSVGSVSVDKGQVVQILMNLVVNARDAMPDGGQVVIETHQVQLNKPTPDTLLHAPPGPYVALTVKDTGTGMTPETKTKVFEPFFTTKPVGKGTGLGLSVVYGVVKQLGGGLAVQSEPGHGTTFSIYFPEVRGDTRASTSDAKGLEKPKSYEGSETILVVEDEDTVRWFVKRALTAQGYTVVEAHSGVEALHVLERITQPVDLMVTDLIMPDMGGRELAARMRIQCPALPVLYTSGYSDFGGSSEDPLASAEHFLPKPFGPSELAQKVREILQRSGR